MQEDNEKIWNVSDVIAEIANMQPGEYWVFTMESRVYESDVICELNQMYPDVKFSVVGVRFMQQHLIVSRYPALS